MKKYILAVSGGPDSMAMLNMYKKRTYAVCTIDYNKRADSKNDVSIVREFCNRHNIRFYLYEVTEKEYVDNKKENFQSLARKIRYSFFVKTCNELKIFNLMIAHNLNDLYETAYMQFSKKSKSLFYGISPKSKYKNINIYRPLLRFKKTTLQRYCDQNNIKYAIDYTNNMDIYERNKIRKIINNWTDNEQLNFKKEIIKYNKKNRKLLKKVNQNYEKWSISNFGLNFIKETITRNKDIAYYLIYNFLKENNEHNNNQHKINNIIDFLLASKNNKRKYRLEANRYLYVLNNKIFIK